ncbi:hypothetical protein HYX11_03780 [Candidatus Woesearchaeota archaeon]|nr:hypothetical protein [Candidatus Woesearchaeota archaeon]
MDLIQQSFQRLYPNKPLNYITKLEYNLRLNDFNANIKLYKNILSINLNLQWKDIDDEIKIGLIQTLLIKIFKHKFHTHNIDLYNNFIRNIPILTKKNNIDPYLEQSFHRVNQQFFQNELEKPNLAWGQASFHKLAHYNFHNDTITVSTIFQKSSLPILDFLMYHELLHKHHQFRNHNGRNSFHTSQFRQDENLYPNKQQIEQEINDIIHLQKRSLRTIKPFSVWDFFK